MKIILESRQEEIEIVLGKLENIFDVTENFSWIWSGEPNIPDDVGLVVQHFRGDLQEWK